MQPWTCRCGQANWGPYPCPRCLTPAPPAASALAPAPPSGDRPATPRWALVVLGALTGLLLGTGVAAAFFVEPSRSPELGAQRRTIEATPGSPAAGAPGGTDDLQSLIPELQAFVEQARGLRFRSPVKVTFLADEDFRRWLQAERDIDDQDREEIRTAEGVLRALHLLERDVDLARAAESLLGAAVVGAYDSESNELVVRGDRPTPQVRATVVHELTHALEDQHFELHRPDLEARTDEAEDAFVALAEGDAVRVERMYLESLPLAEQRQAELEERRAAAALDDVPPILLQLLAFPYLTGPHFVDALISAGGQARLDAAFSTPPTTSEHLLRPETYLAAEGPAAVAAPPAEGRVIDEGVVGEFGLRLILSRAMPAGAVAAATNGWGGDRYVAWRRGGQTCVRASVVMDDPAATARLGAALREWAARHRGAVVRGDGPITFTSCA